METKSKPTAYIVHTIAAAVLMLTTQISLAGSATWLLSPQDSAWENANNWTAGGPPNGPSDIATFDASFQTSVNISTPQEVNGIVFTSFVSFNISVSGSELTISGTGVTDNSGTFQTFVAGDAGQIIFNNASTAGDATIIGGDLNPGTISGKIIFNDSSTAGSAILIARGGDYGADSGNILFNGASTGGTARVEVFSGITSNTLPGFLDIRGHQSGVTIGSIEGNGFIYLGANNLTVGTNDIDTTFYGVIANFGQGGSLAKVGSGVLTLQSNHCFADTVGLYLVSGSIIKLDFTGPPDVIASLVVNGVRQAPGIYGGPISGAPNILPEFAGSGKVSVGPISTLGNISTRAFAQTGDNVMIGGFIITGNGQKTVIVRAIGPSLVNQGITNPLQNPTLELHDHTGAVIAFNDNWMDAPNMQEIIDSGLAPSNNLESAILMSLSPGNYTAIVRGVNNGTGIGLVEAYDLDPTAGSQLGNISTRALVQTGDNVMIGGLIITGAGQKNVIVRAIGPSLAQQGITNPLLDPTLELHDGTGAVIAFDDNWRDSQEAEIEATGLAPSDDRESAIVSTLAPGNYTAIVRGQNNTIGVALIEVYDLN